MSFWPKIRAQSVMDFIQCVSLFYEVYEPDISIFLYLTIGTNDMFVGNDIYFWYKLHYS